MGRLLLYAIPVVITIYALIDAIMTPRMQARSLPKPLWIVLIILIPLLGAIAWLLVGRPRTEPHHRGGGGNGGGAGGTDGPAPRTPPTRPGRRRGSLPPDDDPEFLRRLDQAAWERKMRERRSGNGATGDDG